MRKKAKQLPMILKIEIHLRIFLPIKFYFEYFHIDNKYNAELQCSSINFLLTELSKKVNGIYAHRTYKSCDTGSLSGDYTALNKIDVSSEGHIHLFISSSKSDVRKS